MLKPCSLKPAGFIKNCFIAAFQPQSFIANFFKFVGKKIGMQSAPIQFGRFDYKSFIEVTLFLTHLNLQKNAEIFNDMQPLKPHEKLSGPFFDSICHTV